MAGHSKWANIKRHKGVKDAHKSKLYTKLTKEIVVSIKQGGNKLDSNPRLKIAIQNAKAANVPKANIDKAISKADLSKEDTNYLEVVYEGYSQYGVAIMIECTTNNTNRTVAEVRSAFNKHGGSLSKNGSIDFLFDRKGVFIIPKNESEMLLLNIIDAGAESVTTYDEYTYIIVPIQNFHLMNKTLEKNDIVVEEANLEYIPNSTVVITQEQFNSISKLLDTLDANEDIKAVYHNAEVC